MFQHLHRPTFQGFRQEGVVSVGKGLGADVPGLVPPKAFDVHQQSHELGNGHGGVGVIQLDRSLW